MVNTIINRNAPIAVDLLPNPTGKKAAADLGQMRVPLRWSVWWGLVYECEKRPNTELKITNI